MLYLRIVNGYDKLSDPRLLVECRTIVTNMTGNANFPTPNPSLADMTAAADAFQAAIVNSAMSGTDRGIARQAVLDNIHLEGAYVVYEAKGNPSVVESAGYKVAKRPTTAPSVEVPQLVQAFDTGNPGELLITFKAQRAARSFTVLFGIEPQGEQDFQSVSITRSRVVLRGLVSGQRYTIKVVAIGTRDQRMESAPITRVVQ